jgi:hypothetical protein
MTEDELKQKILAVLNEGIVQVNNKMQEVYNVVKDILTPKSLPIKFGRYMFAHDEKPMSEQAKWNFQVLQGNFPEDATALKTLGVKVIRYCHPATYRDSEVDAIGHLDHERFFLRDINDTVIKRYYNGEENGTFVDIGLLEYQKLSAEFLIRTCQEQGWDGVLFDEVNEFMEWAGYNIRPKKYPTDYSFQTKAWLPYVKYVSEALKVAGLKVYANIAFDGEYDYWARNILDNVDGTLHEFFIGREGITNTASWENWGYRIQYPWMKYNEEKGKESLYQVRTTKPEIVEYALATLLLGVNEDTKAKFAWATGEPGIVESHKWHPIFDKVAKIGKPGPLTVSLDNIYKREFSNGYVIVNPSESARQFEGQEIPPLTGKIVIND